MSRPEVFAGLASRGADRAVVQFSGGNDEGGPDSIALYKGEEEICALSTWPSREEVEDAPADARLVDALSEPVFQEYGTFAGDFDVTGEVIWDVAERTVRMVKDERADYEHSEAWL